MKILFLVYLLIGTLFSPLGYLLHSTIGKAGEHHYSDKVYALKKAFIGKDENLYVCVVGLYDRRETEYWFFVPVTVIAIAPDSIDLADGSRGYWKAYPKQSWYIPRSNIVESSCGNPPINIDRPLEIQVLRDSVYNHLKAVTNDFEESAKDELVYQINVTTHSGKSVKARHLAYANKKLDYYGESAITFRTNSYKRKGSAGWYFLAPFAWLVDVISWPIQLFMWIEYAGSH